MYSALKKGAHSSTICSLIFSASKMRILTTGGSYSIPSALPFTLRSSTPVISSAFTLSKLFKKLGVIFPIITHRVKLLKDMKGPTSHFSKSFKLATKRNGDGVYYSTVWIRLKSVTVRFPIAYNDISSSSAATLTSRIAEAGKCMESMEKSMYCQPAFSGCSQVR